MILTEKIIVECHFTGNSYNEKPSCKMHDDYHAFLLSYIMTGGGGGGGELHCDESQVQSLVLVVPLLLQQIRATRMRMVTTMAVLKQTHRAMVTVSSRL